MFAIIETGGRQYKVAEGEILNIEKIDDKNSVTFNNVLMISDNNQTFIGNPFIPSAKVTAEVLSEGKGEKVLVFKQKPRKCFRKLRGHRQQFTTVKIKNIEVK